jgi:hypothetical protein
MYIKISVNFTKVHKKRHLNKEKNKGKHSNRCKWATAKINSNAANLNFVCFQNDSYHVLHLLAFSDARFGFRVPARLGVCIICVAPTSN